MQQPFVERQAELSQLYEYLQCSHNGQRQVCFVVGEAGSGKTTLIHEFSVEAEERYENLLFLAGTCNAQTGIGDSYLPFRQIVFQLFGDTESLTGLVSTNNSKRLRSMLKTSGRALMEVAPELVGTLIPGASLLMSLGKFAATEFGWLDSLKKTAERSSNGEAQIASTQLIFQYTALIREIASETPLVIILDDLQWADEASITLLFHLIRELESSPILFVGMYRPNDIELDRNNGERHPLRSTLNEVKRYHGNVWIDLDKIQQERGRAFVDAFLDTSPNQLDESFRQHLVKLTGGHPLFTSEILRNMKDDDDIIQNNEGYWTVTAKLDWDDIPPRIEAVIEERIDRLDNELKEWLLSATVEGLVFTPQILAPIHNCKPRYILKRLSRELVKKHRLVREAGEVKVSNGWVPQYTFTHSLFRQYLYSTINNTERRMLHGDVAEALEDIFSNNISLIVTQLAYHYMEAGNIEQAVEYRTKAAEFAMNVGDIKQASMHTEQALEMTNDLPESGLQRGWLHYLLGSCKYLIGNTSRAEIEYSMSIEILTQADELELSLYPINDIGEMLQELRRYSEALEYFKTAYKLAVQYDNKMKMSESLRGAGLLYRRTDHYDTGMKMLKQALQISQEINDEEGIASCYNSLSLHERRMGNFDLGQKYQEFAVAIIEKSLSSHVYLYSMVLGNLASLLRQRGKYTESLRMGQKALAASSRVGNVQSIAYRRCSFAHTYYLEQEYKRSKQEVNLGKPLAEKTQNHGLHADFLLIEGLLALRANKPDETIEFLLAAYELGGHRFKSTILTIYAIAHARAGNIQGAKDKSLHAIATCNEFIQKQPERYVMYYYRGLAQATLIFIDAENQRKHLTTALESYRQAAKLCRELGVIKYQHLLLDELKPLDGDGLLKPISNLFAKLENTAA